MRRRDFIKKSCGACGAMSLGLLLGSSFLESCGAMKLTVVKAAAKDGKITIPVSSFTENNATLVRVKDYPFDIAVKKQQDNTYLALVLMCTHAGHPLVKSGNSYYCTLHGSRFNEEGHVVTAPASRPLMQLPAKTVNDHLNITLIKPSLS